MHLCMNNNNTILCKAWIIVSVAFSCSKYDENDVDDDIIAVIDELFSIFSFIKMLGNCGKICWFCFWEIRIIAVWVDVSCVLGMIEYYTWFEINAIIAALLFAFWLNKIQRNWC